jgi:hypothetical protein
MSFRRWGLHRAKKIRCSDCYHPMTCVKFAAFDGAGFSESSLISGEVSEWSKEHAWKVCKSKGFEGSNPSLTAKLKSPF